MSDNDDVADLFAGRPETVFIDGVGEVSVKYVTTEEVPLPLVAPTDVYAHSSEIAWSEVGDELLVYHHRLATSHVLDGVSSLLWQCIDGVSPLHEIFSDIADAFAQPLDAIVSDLATVVAEWKRDSLLVASGDVSPIPDHVGVALPTWRHLVDPPNN
jgi:hypothetical protein